MVFTGVSQIEAKPKLEEWNVETLGRETFASHPNYPTLRLPLRVAGAGGPLILDWAPAPHGKNIFVLSYVAGEIGSSDRVKVIRAMVVDVARSNILTDQIFSYVDPLDASAKKGPQPKWNWTHENLLINKTDSAKPVQVSLRSELREESVSKAKSK